MTQKECEAKILELAKMVWDVYAQYNPNGDYLTLSFSNDGYIQCNNAHWDRDVDKPLDFCMFGDDNE